MTDPMREDRSTTSDGVHVDLTKSRLLGRGLTIGYDDAAISEDLSVDIPNGVFTVIVGPNACGKSTLLRALARLLTPRSGEVVLDGRDIRDYPAKEVARRLGLLPQTSLAPDGIRVADLVSRGRFPRQSMFRQWTTEDAEAVRFAMEATRVTDLAGVLVDELSGGQRQRVWVAMVLAQETPLILLDEPTTYLDIAHQVELLDLCADLQRHHGRTVVAVLHDLNQAFRYADHLIAMASGEIVAQGRPSEIVDADLVERVFGLSCRIVPDPESNTPMVIPRVTR